MAQLTTFDRQRTTQLIVKRSSIHGKGLFAGQSFEPGDYVGRYEGPVVTKDGPYVLWIYDEDDSCVGIDGKNHMRWMNHSSHPNVEFINDEIYALRPIEPGEEILIHYGVDWDDVD